MKATCKPTSITVYVNCNTTSLVQNGKSWATPFKTLQPALDHAANECVKVYIHIAKGAYVPSKVYSPNGRVGGAYGHNVDALKTFHIPNNTTLIGGFLGNEKCRNEAKWENETTLDGLGIYWHVVTVGNDLVPELTSTVSMHNLSVSNGAAFGPTSAEEDDLHYDHGSGGSIYVMNGCTLKLRNMTFVHSAAKNFGGGIYSKDSTLLIDLTWISGCRAEKGGAVYYLLHKDNTSSDDCKVPKKHVLKFKGGEFPRNTGRWGSVFHIATTNPNTEVSAYLEDCLFRENSAASGIVYVESAHAELKKCTFNNNRSEVSGAITVLNTVLSEWSTYYSSPFVPPTTYVSESKFTNNVCSGLSVDGLNKPPKGGGALSCGYGGQVEISHCEFTGNSVLDGYGGALLNGYGGGNKHKSLLKATKSSFTHNIAQIGDGGAIANVGEFAELKLVECKFKDNKAPNGTSPDVYSPVRILTGDEPTHK